MFDQSPLAGPGTESVTDHTLEVLLLLGGAFLLGWLLQWLLSRRLVQQHRNTVVELIRTRERLTAAERRPAPTARLREANSTEHERTLSQLRESREAESRARERIIELEGRLALAEHAAEKPAPVAPDVLDAVLPFVSGPGSKSGRK